MKPLVLLACALICGCASAPSVADLYEPNPYLKPGQQFEVPTKKPKIYFSASLKDDADVIYGRGLAISGSAEFFKVGDIPEKEIIKAAIRAQADAVLWGRELVEEYSTPRTTVHFSSNSGMVRYTGVTNGVPVSSIGLVSAPPTMHFGSTVYHVRRYKYTMLFWRRPRLPLVP